MNVTLIILAVVCGILVIGIIYMISVNVKLSQSRIDPINCPVIKGDFGVYGAKSYQTGNGATAVLHKCGTSGTDACEAQANNISDAITYCNTYVNYCDAFVFSVTTKRMAIVDTTLQLVSDATYDLYTRQYPKDVV